MAVITWMPSVVTLAGLGIAFGAGLAYAARKFHVPVDPKIEQILAMLPGANCGACGKSGCMGFAQALAAGELNVQSCAAMAQEKRQSLAEFLGLNVELRTKMVSVLRCNGGNKAKDRFLYDGMKDCLAASLVLGGPKECRYGCLTYETCVVSCPFEAINMTPENYPQVIDQKCTSCGVCVNVCPKKLYQLIPAKAKIYVACSSKDLGKVVMSVCSVGCIACKRCEKACPHGAIMVVENLARIDYEKCTGCLACVKVCPTKVIKEK